MGKKIILERMKVKSIIIFSSLVFFLIFSIASTLNSNDLSGRDLLKNETVKGELGKKIDRYLSQITSFGFSGALLMWSPFFSAIKVLPGELFLGQSETKLKHLLLEEVLLSLLR